MFLFKKIFFKKILWCQVRSVHVSTDAWEGQRVRSPELKLQTVVHHAIWMLGTEHRYFTRAVCVLNLWVISPPWVCHFLVDSHYYLKIWFLELFKPKYIQICLTMKGNNYQADTWLGGISRTPSIIKILKYYCPNPLNLFHTSTDLINIPRF